MERGVASGGRRGVRGRSAMDGGMGLALSLGLALVCGLGLVGCAGSRISPEVRADREQLSESNQEISRGTLAAVEVKGQNLATVRETVESVFTAAGFRVGKHRQEEMVFERPASRRLVATYGSWGGIEVWVRLKVEITPQNPGDYLLRCRSYVVREPGTMAEGEQPLARRQVREYQDLLHEVATRLN